MIPKLSQKHPYVLVSVLLALCILAAFAPSLYAPTFIAHESSILRLPLLSWWKNVPLIFSRDFLMFSDGQFRPLSYALLAIVRTMVESDNVLFWHVWLLGFHWLNAILVFVLVRHFSKHLWSAALAAVFFSLHPLGSVAVNNINYFHYVLGLTFYLGALCGYLSFVRASRRGCYIAAVGLFVLGLFTSKVVFTLPIVLGAYELLYQWKQGRVSPSPPLPLSPSGKHEMLYRRSRAQGLVRLLPFVAFPLLLSPFYVFYEPHPLHYKYIDFPAGMGWNSFFSTVGATGRYVEGLLFARGIPVVLHEVVEQIYEFTHWKFLLWGIVNLGVLLAAGWAVRRKSWIGLGVLFSFGAMLPFASTLWNRVEDWASWAYLYVPVVGLAFFAGGLADALEIRTTKDTKHTKGMNKGLGAFVYFVVFVVASLWPRRWRTLRAGVLAALSLVGLYYGIQQVRINAASRSALGYWTRVVQLNPNSETAALELGKAYLQRGEATQALRRLFSPTTKHLRAPSLAMTRYYTGQGDYLAAALHLRMTIHEEAGLQFQDHKMAAAELLYAAGAPDHAEDALGVVLIANPYNVAAMGRLAEVWLLKGYVPAAERLTKRALEIAPSHSMVSRMRAALNARQNTLSDTSQVVRPPAPWWLRYVTEGLSDPPLREAVPQSSERHRDDPVIQMEAVMRLVQRGQYDLALSRINQVTQSLSSCAYAWAIKCWVAAKAGAYREALAAGLRAQDLDPKSPTVHSVLGVLFGKLAGARPAGPARQRDLEQAIWQFEFALRLDPRNTSAHTNLGNLLAAQGKTEEAIEHYRQAIKISRVHAEAHANLGDLLAAQGKTEEAIEHYRQALQSRPDYVKVHTNLGNLLARQGKLAEAIGHFRQAMRIQPDHAEAYNNLGTALAQQGKFEEAIGQFRQALRLQPDLVNAHYNLGNLLTGQGKLEEAIGQFRQALRLQPDHAEAYNSLGIALGQQRKLEEAIGQFRQAIRLRPTYAQAYTNLSMALVEQGRFEEAIRVLREGLTRVPNHLGLAILLPWVLATCPDPDLRNGAEAVQLAERVCRATGYKVPQALDALAAAYAEVGRFDEAIQQAQQALQLAMSSGQDELGKKIAARLKLYKAHRAAHEQP